MSEPVVVRVPGDKSISHRALIFAALADGPSSIRGILRSEDLHSTAGVLRALGVRIPELADEITIVGVGRRGLAQPARDLDCGNSGTTTRLISGVVAALPIAARFIGDASLSRRPMHRVAEPLTRMGARFEFEHDDGLPMTIRGGTLDGIAWQSATPSAQVKSAILLAGLVSGSPVSVSEPARSRDHTERLLHTLGAHVTVNGTEVRLGATERLAPLHLRVPADPSSAAYPVALGVLRRGGGGVLVDRVCLNDTRTGFLRALRAMGAAVSTEDVHDEGGERIGTVRAAPSSLAGIAVGGDAIPAMIDELPMLACVAARAEGETSIGGAAELRVKESDRIAVVVSNLRAIGADAEERADGMVVRGSRAPLRGTVRTHGDHRIAMAFGVLGAVDGNAITIDDPGCVAVSYPTFWDDLHRILRG
ncbi:MAG: 3-phosphoshikimate 1-carboxyvinyltransferase [Gemmatimonadaceae bacterium]